MTNLEEAIRERAYHLWTADGQPEGKAEVHWLKAQREILTTSMEGSGGIHAADFGVGYGQACQRGEGRPVGKKESPRRIVWFQLQKGAGGWLDLPVVSTIRGEPSGGSYLLATPSNASNRSSVRASSTVSRFKSTKPCRELCSANSSISPRIIVSFLRQLSVRIRSASLDAKKSSTGL